MIEDSRPGETESGTGLSPASSLREPADEPVSRPIGSGSVFSLHAPATDPLSGDAPSVSTSQPMSPASRATETVDARAAAPSEGEGSEPDRDAVSAELDTLEPGADSAGPALEESVTVSGGMAPVPRGASGAATRSGRAETIERTDTGEVDAVDAPTAKPSATSTPTRAPGPPGRARDLTGQVLSGRYLMEQAVGEGAMGSVYLATHTLIKKKVAIKILHPEIARDAEIQERFQREAQAAAHIDHRNICAATDFGITEEGMLFLVMEYLDGETLEAVIERGVLDPVRVVRIVDQIASALSRAHALGIVHRDLKPENIFLVERDGETDVVKIVDFGIARVYLELEDAQSEASTRLTQAGMVYGTPHYLSPEQAAGEPVTPRSDLYAVGVMMFEMLTGQRPFSGTLGQLLAKHMTREPPHFAEVAPEVEIPAGLEDVVRLLMAKVPDERVESADVLRTLVHPFGDGTTSGLMSIALLSGVEAAAPTSVGSAGPGFVDKARATAQDLWARAQPIAKDLWERLLRFDPPVLIGAGVALMLFAIVITALIISGGDESSGEGAETEAIDTSPVEETTTEARPTQTPMDLAANPAARSVALLAEDPEIEQAFDLIRNGAPEDGLELLREQTADHADEPAFDALLADAYRAVGDYEQAMFTVQRLIDLDGAWMDEPTVRRVILEVFSSRKKKNAEPAIELLESRMSDDMENALFALAMRGEMRDKPSLNLRNRIAILFEESGRYDALEKWQQLSFEMRRADRASCDERKALVLKIQAHDDPRTLPVVQLQEAQTPLDRNNCMEEELPLAIKALGGTPQY